jgi:hypothetical protein
MRHLSGRVGAILMSAVCATGAGAVDAADCTDCEVLDAIATVLDEDDVPRWLLSLTFDDPNTRFGVAIGFAEIATPFERALIAAGVDVESNWTIGLRFEIPL